MTERLTLSHFTVPRQPLRKVLRPRKAKWLFVGTQLDKQQRQGIAHGFYLSPPSWPRAPRHWQQTLNLRNM